MNEKLKNNSYLVTSGRDLFLCNKINGEYIVKNKNKDVIKNPLKAIKL